MVKNTKFLICKENNILAAAQPPAREGRQGELRASKLDDDPGLHHGHGRELGRAPHGYRDPRPWRGAGRPRLGRVIKIISTSVSIFLKNITTFRLLQRKEMKSPKL